MSVYWIWFAQLKNLSLWKKKQLLSQYPNPEELYQARENTLAYMESPVAEALMDKDLTQANAILAQCKAEDIGIVTYEDARYPQRLKHIEDPPMVLYTRGVLPDWQAQPMIGVVGTRKASSYGLQVTRMLAGQIAICGGVVISGAAAGIDSWAMEAAMEAGAPVVGVLGGGVDVVYPASNRKLYEKTVQQGCLISQYPPGSRPFPGNFLQRNRIISGISDGVLVVEAPEKSGALNTAQHALSQGRDLFVAPGNLGVDSCLGSNALLQEGAYPILSGWDVVKNYGTLYPGKLQNRMAALQLKTLATVAEDPQIPQAAPAQKPAPSQKSIDNLEKSTYSVLNKPPKNLSGEEMAILELLTQTPQFPDSVIDRSELPPAAVQSVLTRLAIKGLVQHHPDGRVSRK